MPGQGSSKYIPSMSGGEVTVPSSGSITVDTDVRDLDHAQVSLIGTSIAACATVSYSRVARVPGDLTAKITIKTWKADGLTAADAAGTVAWTAFGKF
jgi:hypothetical protein